MRRCLILVVLLAAKLGCREGEPAWSLDTRSVATDGPEAEDLSSRADLARPRPDLAKSPDAQPACPVPDPPPAQCNQRKPGVTATQVMVRVDEYRGVKTGRNGIHEIVEGTVLCTSWVYKMDVVDTKNVELAMRVHTVEHPGGLPMEIPLAVGQRIEVTGEYIPAASANASNMNGPAAVVHFTHSPCGAVTISGMTYR